MAAPKLKLTYFPAKGRAQPIRICLRAAKLEFEDERLAGPAFGEKKAAGTFPLGQLPVLSIDGTVHCQSHALARWAAKKAGLYPADADKALVVDEVLATLDEAMSSLPYRTPSETDESFKPKREAWFPKTERFWKLVDARLAANGGPFFLGKDLSLADLALFNAVGGVQEGGLDFVPKDAFNAFPAILAHHAAAAKHDIIVSYDF
jgi:glutathione S-transferase